MIEAPLGRDREIDLLVPSLLSDNPPPCVLLHSPPSTGKRTLAQYLARRAGVPAVDLRLFPVSHWVDEKGRQTDSVADGGSLRLVEPELSMPGVRDLIDWAKTAPRTRHGKVAIVRLDHEREDGSRWFASSAVCSALLKTLEEPPEGTCFMLLAAGQVLPTIASRSSVTVSWGALSLDQVADILYKISDLSVSGAREAAALGGGRVRPSLRAQSQVVGSREAVLGVLSDLESGNVEALVNRASSWTENHTEMLIQVAHERVTGKYGVFSSEEISLIPQNYALKMLSVIQKFRNARPRILLLAVTSALSERSRGS